MRPIYLSEKDVARFWALVRIGTITECWLFMGAKSAKGYGRFKLHGRLETASRVAFAVSKAQPAQSLVLHQCDTPACCNPAHLFLGTNSDNVRDMVFKGRQSRRGGARGQAHHSAKFTQEQVTQLRASMSNGVPARRLAREMGVSSRAIDKIRHGVTWAHIARRES